MNGERLDHTLQATDLVHEALLRLRVDAPEGPEGRRAFVGRVVESMRWILVDHARSRNRLKRGGGAQRVPLESLAAAQDEDLDQILSLDEAIERLKSLDGEVGSVVELRHYGGLTNDEVANHLGISVATVKRRWEFARAWLYRECGGDRAPAREAEDGGP